MEAIHKAADLYMRKFKEENQGTTAPNNDYKKLDDDIHRYISISIKSISPASKLFTNNCIFDTLITALIFCVTSGSDVKDVTRAYRCLEKYFCLLVQQPWKPEYKTLKTYGGFYKTKVKSVLTKAESIFHTAGYEQDREYQMVYMRINVDKPQLLILSFDCSVAAEICERISEHYNQLRTLGKTLHDAISDILQSSWPNDDSRREKLFVNLDSKVLPPPALPKRESLIKGSGGRNGFNNSATTPSGKEIINGSGGRNGFDNSAMTPSGKEIIYSPEPPPVYDADFNGTNPEQSLSNFRLKPCAKAHIAYMDEAEHYPNWSKATQEEHVAESLRHLNVSDGKSLSDEGNMKDFPGKTPVDRVTTYPPRRTTPLGQYPTPHMKELEGIESDVAGLTKAMYGAPYTPSKSTYFDQGYHTGFGFSNTIPSASDQEMSGVIYRPPSVTSQISMMKSTAPLPPPPIPSRGLKPCVGQTLKPYDTVDGFQGDTVNRINNPAATPPLPHGVFPPQDATNNFNDLRFARSLIHAKSKSLKTESKKVINDSRPSRSMDYALAKWQCLHCEMSNSPEFVTCVRCSQKRYIRPQAEPKKACKKCTLLNDWGSTSCEICEELLPEELTYTY